MSTQEDIIEEYEDNRPTGVEYEDQRGLDLEQTRPYDPRKIRVDSKFFPISQILDMIKNEELDVAPEFQRRKVWSNEQKSLLIESIFLRIPLPVFYFAADEEGLLQVVDGVQRISTISSFFKNEFPLSKLEYLNSELIDKKYDDIKNTLWSRRFLQTQLSANVIDPQTPDDVKFDIFKRINTGGTPLNPQEIRHCITKKRSRNFLAELCQIDAFHQATRGQLKDHSRMADREVVLRYCAFKLMPEIVSYSSFNGIDELLTHTARNLDNKDTTSDHELIKIKDDFILSMNNAILIFGEHAFRKWYTINEYINPFNRALFDVWSVLLSSVPTSSLTNETITKIRDDARVMMTFDSEFIKTITSGTSKHQQVTLRFNRIKSLLEKALA